MAIDTSEITTDSEATAVALREQTRSWLATVLPDGWMAAIESGDTDTYSKLRRDLNYDDWCTTLGEAGYATPTWPAEYGAGLSLNPGEARSVNEVLNLYRVPRPFNIIGIGMGGPTLITHGTEEQKKKLLPGLATNQEIWCQLFSEPGAGSDVAGLGTRAVLDGDEWIINGQKVWTTLAHISRWGMLLARTSPDIPKHRGLSYFIIDMHAPGVEVRPLVQITGDAEFNEVFMDNVRIPDSMRVGAEGDGWRVGITTLMNERIALSGAGSLAGDAAGGSSSEKLIARHTPVADVRDRQRLAQLFIDERLIKFNNQRAAERRRSGGEAGPEGSITKLMQAEFNQRLQKVAIDLEGAGGMAWEGSGTEAGTMAGFISDVANNRSDISRTFLRAQANTIEGGTSNIMRNILGERVLGLPKDADGSRDIPWIDVPK